MMPAALPTDVVTVWWVTLGVGLVVALVVVVLLHTLLRAVNDVEQAVTDLWQAATTVARNTATTWQLAETARAVTELRAEVERQPQGGASR